MGIVGAGEGDAVQDSHSEWRPAPTKYWELVSGCREEKHILERMGDSPEWAMYLEWLRRNDQLIINQERDKLDHPLPDALCRHVLAASRFRYQISNGHVRQMRGETDEPTFSAVDIYDRYGGGVIEDVQEYGSVNLEALYRFGR